MRDPLSRTSLERGLGTASGLIRQSLSHATWVSYAKVWSEWESLLGRVDTCVQLDDWVTVVLYFLGQLFEGGVSVSGINRRMAALAFWFNLKGVGAPTRHFLVRQALRGLRKGHSRRDARRPVSFSLLGDLQNGLGQVCSSDYECLLFRAAFALAFFDAGWGAFASQYGSLLVG